MSNQVLNRAADARGDGLLVYEGDGRAGLEKTFLHVFGGRLVGGGNGDGGGGGLDHSKRGDNIFERVFDL